MAMRFFLSLVVSVFILPARWAHGDVPWECIDSGTQDPPANEMLVLPDSLRGLVIWARDTAAQATIVPVAFPHSLVRFHS